jgi:hypothetical protein
MVATGGFTLLELLDQLIRSAVDGAVFTEERAAPGDLSCLMLRVGDCHVGDGPEPVGRAHPPERALLQSVPSPTAEDILSTVHVETENLKGGKASAASHVRSWCLISLKHQLTGATAPD